MIVSSIIKILIGVSALIAFVIAAVKTDEFTDYIFAGILAVIFIVVGVINIRVWR